jgi:hypothetical protein
VLKSLAVMMMVLVGCGSDSAEERICNAVNGCGALAMAGIDQCVATLEGVDAERALSECATCLEAKTCAEINDGACAPNCAPFASLFEPTADRNKRLTDVTDAEANALCTYALDQMGGEGVSESCGSITVNSGTVAQCVNHLLTVSPGTCTATIGQYQDCFAAADSPCDPLTTPACAPYGNCR